jgi:uncharacterized protein YukE
MPQTPVYNFEEDSVLESINISQQQLQRGQQEAAEIRQVVQPLIDGMWIGEAAEAFFQRNEEFLKLADTLNDDIQWFINTTKQAMDQTVDTMGKIDATTGN